MINHWTFNYEKVPITKKVKNNDTYPRYIKRLSCVLKYNVIHSKVTSKKTAVDTMNMNVPPKKLIYYSLFNYVHLVFLISMKECFFDLLQLQLFQ